MPIQSTLFQVGRDGHPVPFRLGGDAIVNRSVCSLFAGIGGFDLGFQSAGLEPVVHIEIDAACRKVLAARFPESEIGSDVRAIPALIKRIRKSKPVSHASRRLIDAIRSCGTICGGFPCQDLSVAGLRAGLDGERSGLWHVYRRIVALLRPPWVVIENVPGLLSSNGGEDMRIVVSGLEKLGYGVAWRTLDAQYFDVPQRRERVFIVASLGNLSCAEVLLERESLCWDTPPSREAGKEVAGTLGGSSQSGGFRTTDLDNSGAFIVGAVTSKWAKGTGGPAGDECQNLVAHCLRSEGHDASEDGTGRGTPLVVIPILEAGARTGTSTDDSHCGIGIGQEGDPMFTLQATKQHAIAFSCKDHGADVGDVSPTLRAMNHDKSHLNGGGQVAVAFQESQTGTREYALAGTLRANGPGHDPVGTRIRSGTSVRRLTPTECLRLQGFPDDWLDGLNLSDSTKYKMCGNAVNVAVAEWIGKRLIANL